MRRKDLQSACQESKWEPASCRHQWHADRWVVAQTPAGGAASTQGLCSLERTRGTSAGWWSRLVEQGLTLRTCRQSGVSLLQAGARKAWGGHAWGACHEGTKVSELCWMSTWKSTWESASCRPPRHAEGRCGWSISLLCAASKLALSTRRQVRSRRSHLLGACSCIRLDGRNCRVGFALLSSRNLHGRGATCMTFS